MKKFRFLIFMLMLTSIFIGCAQPTDDSVVPEVPKTATEAENTTEAEPTDDSVVPEVSDEQPTDVELYTNAKLILNQGVFLRPYFNVKGKKFKIKPDLFGKIISFETVRLKIVDEETAISIMSNDDKYDQVIPKYIKQIYEEVK